MIIDYDFESESLSEKYQSVNKKNQSVSRNFHKLPYQISITVSLSDDENGNLWWLMSAVNNHHRDIDVHNHDHWPLISTISL